MCPQSTKLWLEKMAVIFDSVETEVCIISPQFEMEYANPALLRTLGRVEGRSCFEYFQGRTERCEWCRFDDVLKGDSARWEWPAAREGRVFEVFDSLIRDEEGGPHKLTFLRDVTDRKRAEEERHRMQEEVFQASKLASLGTLAASVAHEINNPLAIIRGSLEMIEDTLEEKGAMTEVLRKQIGQQDKAIARITEIVKSLLNHARGSSDAVVRLDLHSAIQDTLSLVGFIYKKQNVRIVTEFCKKKTFVQGNLGKFQQVIMNLLVNAKEAIAEKGGDGLIHVLTECADGKVHLKISDNGCGIPPEHQEKIFASFFTTKGPGQGTGLGLAISLAIIRSMGGTIEVASRPGEGTVFTVTLPLA